MHSDMNEDVTPQSSTGNQTQDVDDGVQDMAPVDADSSPADDVAEDTLSIVQDVAGAEASTEAPESSTDGDENGDAADQGLSDEDIENLPFGKHPRFQQVLGRVKDAEAKVEELNAKAAEFETDAARYRNVEAFLQNNSLSADEAAGGLEVLALAKTDPVKAWEQIKPWVSQLATAAGAIVPPDLQKRVQEGHMTPDAAREMAMAKARSTTADNQRQMAAAQMERQQQEQARNAVVASVVNWETERKLRDPNFDSKYNALQREVAFIQTQEGRPADPAGVKHQLDRAYAAVNKTFAPAAPKPAVKKAIKPVVGGQSAGKPSADMPSTVNIIDDVMARG